MGVGDGERREEGGRGENQARSQGLPHMTFDFPKGHTCTYSRMNTQGREPGNELEHY